jgi:sec-independent protein translocase protein TatA
MRMGMSELLVVLAIVMVLFGAKRLPDLADGMGKAIRNFKRGMNQSDDDDVTPADKQVTARSSAAPLDEAKATAGERKS